MAPRRQAERRDRAGEVEAFFDRDREPGKRPGVFRPAGARYLTSAAAWRALSMRSTATEWAVDGSEPRGEMFHPSRAESSGLANCTKSQMNLST